MTTMGIPAGDTLDLSRRNRIPARAFDYIRRDYANATVFQIHGYTRDSGAVGTDSALLGLVARPHDTGSLAWWVTPDSGQALRWWGPFTSRVEAARFLLGGRVERYLPARRTDLSGTETPRAQVLDHERVEGIVGDLLAAVRALRAHDDDDGNDEEIAAAHELAGEVEAACADLRRMIAQQHPAAA